MIGYNNILTNNNKYINIIYKSIQFKFFNKYILS